MVYDPALPLETFVDLVAGAGLRRISLSQAEADAFGIIRLRSALERVSMRVGTIYWRGGPAVAARAALLAQILQAERVSDAPPGEVLQGDSLAALAERSAGEFRLNPDAWLAIREAAR